MNIKLNKSYGDSLLNTIRQIAMTQDNVLRPIAFKVGINSTVLTIGDSVTEDMTEFISNVTSLDYRTDGNQNLVVWEGICNSVLAACDLESHGIKVIGENKELLHSFVQVPVTIYFKYGCAHATRDENCAFLENNNIDVTNLVVIASRHCKITEFNVEKGMSEDAFDFFSVTIKTKDGTSETQVFKNALSLLKIQMELLYNFV